MRLSRVSTGVLYLVLILSTGRKAISSPTPAEDFQTVCSGAGIIKCVSFDSTTDLAGRDGVNTSGTEPGTAAPQIDSSVKSSGAGSLKFTIPSKSGASASGYYFTDFSSNLGTQFGANSEFYVQWRQRFSPEFATTKYAAGNGWKQMIIGSGDQPGKFYYACSDLEVVTQNTYYYAFPQMYNSCTGSTSHQAFDDFWQKMGTSDLKLQNARPSPYCLYSQTKTGTTAPPTGNCSMYYANEWMTFQVHVKTGSRVNDEFTNSYVQLWVAREGQPAQLVLDWGPYNLTAGSATANQKYGKVYLLPYNTNKDATVSYPVAYTWYDDLIISTQPISMTYGTTGGTSDTTPPTVFVNNPLPGATISGTATVAANASDNVGIAGVQFKWDGSNLAAELTSAPYSVSFNTLSVANGPHTLSAVARDAAGNLTTSASVSVTVSNADITPPTVSLTAPSAGATVVGTTSVSAVAADNLGVAGVQFKLDGANLGAEVLAAPFTTSWTTSTAANGSHTLTATARDAAGNRTTSAAVSITVNNSDTTAPSVSITAPLSGATVSGTVTVSGSASDNIGVAGVQFQLDGANLGAEVTAAPYSTSWNTASAANGSHTLAAIARDAAGNRKTATAVSVTVSNADTTLPTVFIRLPLPGATVSGTLTVSADASDNIGVVGVQFQLDGVNLGPEVTATPYSTSWNTASAANGSHALAAIARDAAGNRTTSAAISVTVNNADTAGPTVSMTAPLAGATVAGTITVSANAADNIGVAGVQFQLDGVNLGAEVTTAPFTIPWNTANAANGSHALAAIARDAAGNRKTSLAISLTVNNADTTVPTVSLTVPSAGATVAGTITVSANATDNIGVAGVQFQLDGVNLGAELTAAPYTTSWNTASAANGSHSLAAIVRDAAGNRTVSAGVSVNVSNAVIPPSGIDFSLTSNGGNEWFIDGSSAAVVSGYADVRMNNPGPLPSGTAIFGLRSNGVLVTEAGVTSSVPALSGRIYVNVNGPVSTGLAFANPNSSDATVEFYFTDTAGKEFGRSSFVLKANHHLASFLTEAPFNGGSLIEGTFTFSSSIPVAATALQGFTNERGEFLITTLPVAPLGQTSSNTAVIPHYADGGGWMTEIVLTNSSDSTVSGTVQFYSQGTVRQSGQPTNVSVNGRNGSTFTYLIPARSAVRLSTGGRGGKTQAGSIRVVSSSGPTPMAFAVFSYTSNGVTVAEASVSALSSGTAFRMYAESSGVAGQAGAIQTGVAIANPSGSNVIANIEAVNLDGSSWGVPVAVTIPANGQIAQFAQELFPSLPSGFRGLLKVTSNAPVVITALRARYNERNDFLITTTEPRNDALPGTGSEIVFPHIVSGGGFTTEIIVFGSTGSATLLLAPDSGSFQ